MDDFLGQPLNLGDEVVMILPNYREFVRGIIVSFANTKVNVSYSAGRNGKIRQDPSQVVRVNNEPS